MKLRKGIDINPLVYGLMSLEEFLKAWKGYRVSEDVLKEKYKECVLIYKASLPKEKVKIKEVKSPKKEVKVSK